MKALHNTLHILLFLLLTIVTQIGGVVYLLSRLLHPYLDKTVARPLLRGIAKLMVFVSLYVFCTFGVVPPLAKLFGRERLPLTETNHLQPLRFMTCLLNRNYVRPELRQTALRVAMQMNHQYPGTTLSYLDACFPFINHFPLIPHWSHNDGKKLDLAFCYANPKTGQPLNDSPSPIGYGVSEGPRFYESNTTCRCESDGYWQYGLLNKIVPQTNHPNYAFDSTRTAALVRLLVKDPVVGKLFIEPHLKDRLHLNSEKIRFQGCHAVRHDDHIHVQM